MIDYTDANASTDETYFPAVADSPYVSPAPTSTEVLLAPQLSADSLTPSIPLPAVYVSPLEPIPFAEDPFDLRMAPAAAPPVPMGRSNLVDDRALPPMPQPALPDTPPPAPSPSLAAQAASSLLPSALTGTHAPAPAPATASPAAASSARSSTTAHRWLGLALVLAALAFVIVATRRG